MMRAASLVEPGRVEVRDVAIREPAVDEVLVRMHYASICGSDVHTVYDGFHVPELLGEPGYPGHEGVGVVERSAHPDLPAGSRVLTVPHVPRGGCFAEYQTLVATHALPLPGEVDLRRGSLAQQLGTTVFALTKFLRRPRLVGEMPSQAVVIGAGSAGLFFLQHLAARGIETIVSDLDVSRLEVARRLGAAQTVHEPEQSVVDAALHATDGAGVDLVIEAAGYDVARRAAVEAARTRGTIGLYGFPQLQGPAPFPVEASFRKSLSVEWVSGAQAEPSLGSFRAAIELIRTGRIEVDYCLEAMYDLQDAPAAMAAARAHGYGAAKVGIVMPGAAR